MMFCYWWILMWILGNFLKIVIFCCVLKIDILNLFEIFVLKDKNILEYYNIILWYFFMVLIFMIYYILGFFIIRFEYL